MEESFSSLKKNRPLSSNPSALSRSDTESMEAIPAFSCTDASRLPSIKHLRLKRVFTPELNSIPQVKNEDRKKLKVSDSGRVFVLPDADNDKVIALETEDANGLNLKDREASGNESLPISKMALNRCNSRKVFKTANSFSYRRLLPYLMGIAKEASSVSNIEIVDGVNSEMRSTAQNRDDSKPSENQDIQMVHTHKGRENHVNGVDSSIEEEHIQSTPPESGLFTKTTFDHGSESLEANKLLSENQTFKEKQRPNVKCNTNSMNRLVPNPCSRLRLFNNPGSLSYRRMLPFLMDISKDNSCATMNTQNPISQKTVLEKDDYVSKSKADNSFEKQYTQDLASCTVPLPPSDNSSLDTNDISSNLESNVVTCETCPEEISQPSKSELGLELKDTTSQSEPSSVVSNDVLTKQCASVELESVRKQKMCLDMGSELHNSTAESTEKVGLNQKSSQIKASSDFFVCPNYRPSKGILKRNPLGCRGLCNCLNCASFRLHADRAFEFSRTQMHNAEEVASELMKELANLRILLEKSVSTNDSVGIQLNPNLVKQACGKALEAEKLAKDRLIELNYDLGVHCRIPALIQPKVTFANTIHERAIRAMDPSTTSTE